MAVTPDHGLPLPADGQSPWGDDYRTAMGIIDQRMPHMRAVLAAADNTTPTVIPGQAQYVKAVVPGTSGISPCGCVGFSVANRVQYLEDASPHTRVVAVTVSAVISSAVSPAQNFRIAIAKNGTVDTTATATARDTGSNSFASMSLSTLVLSFAPADYLELWVANLTSSADCIVSDLSMTVRG